MNDFEVWVNDFIAKHDNAITLTIIAILILTISIGILLTC